MPRSTPFLSPSAWQRLGQTLCFLLFLVLFIKTDYSGSDELTWAVNLLFRIDPLLAFSALLAAKTVIVLVLPALITLGLTLIFGRFFCGWLCPLGALIDASRLLFGPPGGNPEPGQRQWKYALLFFLLAAALFGLPLAGYIDPFSLLVRSFTFAVHPALDHATTTLFTWTYQHAPDWVNALTEPVYAVLKTYLLPFAHKVYALSIFSLLLLLVALGLSRLHSRFFCRKICPLGAMLALSSRFSLFKLSRKDPADCGSCKQCRSVCRMGAIDEDRKISTAECTLCLDCLTHCPRSRIHYSLHERIMGGPSINLSRRTVVASLTAGALAPLMLPARPLARQADPKLIRPPGALAEKDFLGQCVRCGECMKVCIGNALQATWLEAGIEGIFTPRLLGRIGYCEFNCTLCGQVCPTGAIRRLSKTEKQATVIGQASFDKNRCLPYAAGVPCIVCEEHCPTPDKAIKFREVEVENSSGEQVRVRQPYVVEHLCIGCGICENKCPISGNAAVLVTSSGESRHAALSGSDGY